MIWLDFSMFLVLFGLFFYVFASSSVTVLHRIYLLLHIVFMIWPLFQFASQTTSSTMYRLFYLSISYIGLSLIGVGWFVFIVFLTGQSYVIRKSRLFLLSTPALVSVVAVAINPNGMFLTINDRLDPLKQLQHGPLYWIMIAQLLVYMAVSVIIMVYKLSKDESARQRTLIKTAMNGMFVLFLFSIGDLVINVLFIDYFTRYIPLISVGMALAAVYLVHAIGRNKVFDIIQTVQRDVMNTMSLGILVLDENDTVIEVNKVIKPIIRLRIGDTFNPSFIASQFKEETAREFAAFFEVQRKRPLDRLEFELTVDFDRYRHIIVQSAPILNQKKIPVGRVLTFQDVTELRLLVEETNSQNEQLQDRNRDLLIMQDELFQANKKLEQMAITDGLTGCFNRRYLLHQLEQEVVTNIRYGIPFSIFLFDLDYFKSINDKYGHLVGDEVLCSTVEAVRRTLRHTDILARYGGEEFTVYLPHTNREQADIIAEMVMESVEQNKVYTGIGDHALSVTISMGVISIEHFEPSDVSDPKAFLRELLAQADAALYEAKYDGRNRIVKRKLA
ncbi:histidine kinase N-terminal 7TM domain-containing diguanylate cyclase [Paenibacillus prosopidis]|uniref:Diguanylate cyclase (GGDEF)-like protein n=1 Tax=Paenibacillus prosopidis TaxID=630520 RepID=A0A368VQY9_9BACL|nr:diguanylate cyclase [Paenibacillus prosopidis]RCW44308.1 diguanylate cyclase (GGDEF)-like protein [Paenibacillus prosopidis]